MTRKILVPMVIALIATGAFGRGKIEQVRNKRVPEKLRAIANEGATAARKKRGRAYVSAVRKIGAALQPETRRLLSILARKPAFAAYKSALARLVPPRSGGAKAIAKYRADLAAVDAKYRSLLRSAYAGAQIDRGRTAQTILRHLEVISDLRLVFADEEEEDEEEDEEYFFLPVGPVDEEPEPEPEPETSGTIHPPYLDELILHEGLDPVSSGGIDEAEVDPATGEIEILLAAANGSSPDTTAMVEEYLSLPGGYQKLTVTATIEIETFTMTASGVPGPLPNSSWCNLWLHLYGFSGTQIHGTGEGAVLSPFIGGTTELTREGELTISHTFDLPDGETEFLVRAGVEMFCLTSPLGSATAVFKGKVASFHLELE